MDSDEQPTRTPLKFERRIFWLAALAGLPGVICALLLLWLGDYTAKTQWTLSLFVVGFWLAFVFTLRERAIRPLQTISNMLAALREDDFSIRARGASADDALGLAYLEVNALSETLRQQRLGALEATALLRTVMAEIDVSVFAFDGERRLRLVNRGGEKLLGQRAERLLGRSAEELGLAEALRAESHRTMDVSFPGGSGRWEVRRNTFRQGGLPHQLLVLSDISRTLREEERQAWQRIIRVLGHEINNSLAPIKSLAGSLREMLGRPKQHGWEDDFKQGLGVIAARAESLNRFMTSYALLARLPQPRKSAVEVEPWVTRVARLEARVPVHVLGGPDLTLLADGDQLDQMLINLVRNGADAALETHGEVRIGWHRNGAGLELWVEDDGPGLASTANLFVPFFTTKPEGSGIGLPLSRQIAEAHGGTLTLENRGDGHGSIARVKLPL